MTRSRWAVVVAAVVCLALVSMRLTRTIDQIVMLPLLVGGTYQADADLRTRHISRLVTYVMGLSVVVAFVADNRVWSSASATALAVGIAFLVIHRSRNESLGLGDVLLAPVLALYIGWFSVTAVPLWLIGASLGAALVAAVQRNRHVAFAPWLVVSAVATILWVGSPTYSG
jgi:prepilin signal peptidase PulO-like enzyme (type II secretory pathway)